MDDGWSRPDDLSQCAHPAWRVQHHQRRDPDVGTRQEVWNYRRILGLLVRRDLKVRYAASFLGYVWSVLDPLLMSLVFWFIFTQIFHRHVGYPPYILFLVMGQMIMSWFQSGVTATAKALRAEAQMVRSSSVPRELWVVRVGNVQGRRVRLQPAGRRDVRLAYRKTPSWDIVFLPLAMLLCFFTGAEHRIDPRAADRADPRHRPHHPDRAAVPVLLLARALQRQGRAGAACAASLLQPARRVPDAVHGPRSSRRNWCWRSVWHLGRSRSSSCSTSGYGCSPGSSAKCSRRSEAEPDHQRQRRRRAVLEATAAASAACATCCSRAPSAPAAPRPASSGRSGMSASTSSRASRSAWSAATARASRPCSASSRAC